MLRLRAPFLEAMVDAKSLPRFLHRRATAAARPLRVLGVPAFQNRALNPYNALLYDALGDLGVDVRDATLRSIFGRRPDIAHVHWPEYLFSANGTLRAIANAGAFVLVMSYFALRKTRVIWTVHNLVAHDSNHPRLEHRMWRWFVNRIDGYIALTASGREAAIARYPELESRPGFVIPHGHYGGVYPADADLATARRELDLNQRERVIVFFGAIRRYKGVPSLVHAFRQVNDPDWRLLIAGRADDDDLLNEIAGAAAGDTRIRIDAEFVPDDRVQYYLRAADLVVLPYRDILNSGSAILALSFGSPVLIPSLGAANDLLAQVGPDWVHTWDGPLSGETLEKAMAWTRNLDLGSRPPLEVLAWDRIAALTNSAFETVCLLPSRRERDSIAAD